MSLWGRNAALATLACACALGFVAAVDARSAQRATLRVTVSAQITKTWDYVTSRQEGDCTVSTRVEGRRTITLRSSRPTIVVANGSPSRVRFKPALVRSVTARARQGGAVTVTERGIGCNRVTHADCAVQQRALANQTLQFYRSRPGEISFRRTRDFGTGFSRACPPEHREVQVEQTGVHEAQGRLVERQLFDRRIRAQTVSGSFEEETEIEGDPDGKVVERVSWTLRFARP